MLNDINCCPETKQKKNIYPKIPSNHFFLGFSLISNEYYKRGYATCMTYVHIKCNGNDERCDRDAFGSRNKN